MKDDEIETSTLLILLAGRVRDRVTTHPATTLGAAFGVGFVLGAGVPDLLLKLGGSLGLRLLSQQLVARSLSSMLDDRMRDAFVDAPH